MLRYAHMSLIHNACLQWRSLPTVAERVGDRCNNFALIRFAAASLVVFSHSFALSGHGKAEPLAQLIGIMDFATAAVISFFIMSGFLIVRSASLAKCVLNYVRARILRIWPGLVFTAFFSAFVIGPLSTELSMVAYFSSGKTWLYAILVSFFDVGRLLPEVFVGNPIPHGVNGSLWTLQVEVWLYGIVGLLMLFGTIRSRLAFNLLVFSAITLYLVAPEAVLQWIPRHDEYMTPRLVGCFILGACLYVNAPYIPLHPLAGVVISLTAALAVNTRLFDPLFYIAFGYWIIFLALYSPLHVRRWNANTDYSYGIYIFAFPIQQLVASWLGAAANPFVFFALTYPLALAMAVVSWRLIESRALKLKKQ